MKELLRPYTESMWRILWPAVLISLVLLYGIGLFYAKDIDSMNIAARETDLRPRVRGQRPHTNILASVLVMSNTNIILTNLTITDVTDQYYPSSTYQALERRLKALEQRLNEEQARRQMVPVPMPMPWGTNLNWYTNGSIKTDVQATDAETARAWELVRRTGEALLQMQHAAQEQGSKGDR